MNTRFSILVPVHNRAGLIREAVDSVLAQTFPDFELIIVDDGSTDRTWDILKAYGTRIRLLRQANQGPEVARNAAASQANGEYLALLDSDDLFLPGALATYDKIIRAFQAPAVIIGSMCYFFHGQAVPRAADRTDIVQVLKYRDFLSKDVAIGMSSSRIVIRKAVFERAGGLRNSTPATFHLDDYNLLLRAGTYGPCVVAQQPATVAYRMHGANSMDNQEAMVRGVLSLVRAERRGGYPGGRARRFARYACIGGIASWRSWVAWQKHCRVPALRLLLGAGPMVAAAVGRKLWLKFHRRTWPLVISGEPPTISAHAETSGSHDSRR